MITRIVPVLLAMALCGLASAQAQDTASLMNEALDKQATIDLNDVLPNALKKIENQTGVRLTAEPVVYELLPWGTQTNVQAKIENRTLRQALDAITRKLALTFVVKEESIELQPTPPLRRMPRRATSAELAALDFLSSTPANLATDRMPLEKLVGLIDQKLAEAKQTFAIENRSADAAANLPVFVPRNATLSEALESIARDTNQTWYPWGKSLVILPKQDQVRQQLEKQVTMRLNGVDVAQVLLDLSRRSGVSFDIQAGAFQNVAPESRNLRLLLDNASIRQALESIAGVTGLSYSVTDKGVMVWNQQQTGPGTRDRAIGMITLDNGLQVLVPTSQVPPDMREYIQLKTKKELDKIRQMMKDENFKPATRPTTNEDL